MSLRARTLPLAAVTPRDRERWAALGDRAAEPNPFLTPAYLATAHRHLPAAADVRLVVIEDDDGMRALLPLSPGGRFRRTPVRCATTAGAFLGSESPLCVPLVDRERTVEVLEVLLTHLGSRRSGLPGLVELTLVPGDGPFLRALTAACARRRVPLLERSRFERAALVPADGAPSPREALSVARRKQVDRLQRRLEREVGPLRLEDRGKDPQAFADFVRVEAAGWKGRAEDGGGALAVVPGAQAWFTDVTDELRDRGDLSVLTLTAGDELVYLSVLLRAGTSAYSLMDTYDERFARHSPGTVGRVLEQEHLLADPRTTLFDPCLHPRHAVPTGLYRDRRPLVGLLLAPRGVLARGLLRALPLVRPLRGRSAPQEDDA